MDCPRCGGFMINDQFLDFMDDTGEIEFWGFHCVICGEILDPVILSNRERMVLSLTH